ncbi:MAG: Undecaprenyl-phosphate mannosyltransferase, partial [uncultured Frankineae bacterium]
ERPARLGARHRPDLRRAGEPAADHRAPVRRRAVGAPARRGRRQPGRHRSARRRAGRGRPACARAAPQREGRPRRRLHRRLHLGAPARLRRRRGDGRRRVALAGAAAAAAQRAGARRPRPRQPLGRRRRGGQLAEVARAAQPRRQRLHPGRAAPAAAGRDRRLPGLPALRPGRPAPGPRGLAGLLLPGRPRLADLAGRLRRRRGAHHLRRAGTRPLEDEPSDRARGAVAGHLVGAAPLARTPAPRADQEV